MRPFGRSPRRAAIVGANAFPNHHRHAYESTLDDYLDAVDYLVDMVGADQVAIGTDFCMGQDPRVVCLDRFVAWT